MDVPLNHWRESLLRNHLHVLPWLQFTDSLTPVNIIYIWSHHLDGLCIKPSGCCFVRVIASLHFSLIENNFNWFYCPDCGKLMFVSMENVNFYIQHTTIYKTYTKLMEILTDFWNINAIKNVDLILLQKKCASSTSEREKKQQHFMEMCISRLKEFWFDFNEWFTVQKHHKSISPHILN